MEEYTEERQEEIRQTKIAERKLLRNSRIFVGIMSFVNVIDTVIIMLALFILLAVLLGRVFKVPGSVGSILWPIMSIILFVGSFVLGFKVTFWIARIIISKAKLEDKLLKDVLEHYHYEKKSEKSKTKKEVKKIENKTEEKSENKIENKSE